MEGTTVANMTVANLTTSNLTTKTNGTKTTDAPSKIQKTIEVYEKNVFLTLARMS